MASKAEELLAQPPVASAPDVVPEATAPVIEEIALVESEIDEKVDGVPMEEAPVAIVETLAATPSPSKRRRLGVYAATLAASAAYFALGRYES